MTAPRTRRVAARTALGVGLALVAARCTYPATEVLVTVASDAPADRITTLRATLRPGDGTTGAGGVHTWTIGGVSADALPIHFTATPAASEARDDHVTLVIDLAMAAGANGEPPVAFRRIALFQFTPRETTRLALFLSVACGATVTVGCLDGAASCSQEDACEAQGLTCGDNGACVGPAVIPVAGDGAVSAPPDVVARDVHAVDARDASDAFDAADVFDVVADDASDASDGPADVVSDGPCGAQGQRCCTSASCNDALVCGSDGVCGLPLYATCTMTGTTPDPCARTSGTTSTCVPAIGGSVGVCTVHCTATDACPLPPSGHLSAECFEPGPVTLQYCLIGCGPTIVCPSGQTCQTIVGAHSDPLCFPPVH